MSITLDRTPDPERIAMGLVGGKPTDAGGEYLRVSDPATDEPVGWVPSPGEEIEVEFTTTAAKFTYDIAYVMSKVTRVSK